MNVQSGRSNNRHSWSSSTVSNASALSVAMPPRCKSPSYYQMQNTAPTRYPAEAEQKMKTANRNVDLVYDKLVSRLRELEERSRPPTTTGSIKSASRCSRGSPRRSRSHSLESQNSRRSFGSIPESENSAFLTNLNSPCESPPRSVDDRIRNLERKMNKLDGIESSLNRLSSGLLPPQPSSDYVAASPDHLFYGCTEIVSVFNLAAEDISRALESLSVLQSLPNSIYGQDHNIGREIRQEMIPIREELLAVKKHIDKSVECYKNACFGVLDQQMKTTGPSRPQAM